MRIKWHNVIVFSLIHYSIGDVKVSLKVTVQREKVQNLNGSELYRYNVNITLGFLLQLSYEHLCHFCKGMPPPLPAATPSPRFQGY